VVVPELLPMKMLIGGLWCVKSLALLAGLRRPPFASGVLHAAGAAAGKKTFPFSCLLAT